LGNWINYFDDCPLIFELANILYEHPGINQYIKQDPLRLEGFLKDVYGAKYKREIFLLVIGAKAKVNERLDKISNSKYAGPVLRETISYLSSTYSLDEKSAAWITIVWAIGSKKLTEAGYKRFMSELRRENSRAAIINMPVLDNLPSYFALPDKEIIGDRLKLPIDCDTSESLFELGNSLHNQGKFAEAIECYDRALSLNPQDHNSLSNKGLSMHNQGKFAEAIECYDRALSLNQDDSNILRRKNCALETLHRNRNSWISSPSGPSTTNRKRSPNFYLLGIILTAGLLISGVMAYVVLGFPNFNKQYTLGNQGSHSNYSLNNTESKELQQQSWVHTNPIDKQSISIFTDKVENEINNAPFITKEVQTDASKRYSGSNIEVIPNDTLSENTGIDYTSKTINKFELELSKAMKTEFD
jgi:tetratricopeptide (TPR) repeat protein